MSEITRIQEAIEMLRIHLEVSPEAFSIIEAVLSGNFNKSSLPAITGWSHYIVAVEHAPCPTCGGSGDRWVSGDWGCSMDSCPTCKGTGRT